MSETNAETPLAPSETAKTEKTSQRRRTRSRRDNSGASSGRVRLLSHALVRDDELCSSAAAERLSWLRKERVEIAVLRAADQRLDLGPGVDQRRAAGVRRVADGDLPVGPRAHLDPPPPVAARGGAGQPPLQVRQLARRHSVVDPVGHWP